MQPAREQARYNPRAGGLTHLTMITRFTAGRCCRQLMAVSLSLWASQCTWHHGMEAHAQVINPLVSSPPPVQTTASKANPASKQQLQDYLQQGGLSVCFLVKRKVDFKTALAANTSAVMLILSEKHKSLVAGRAAPIDPRTFTTNVSVDIAIKAINSCPKVIPEDIRSEAKHLSDRVREQLSKGADAKNENQ